MMKKTLKKNKNIAITLVMMFSFLLINVGSYRDTSQHKTNGFFANSGNGYVIVTKVGYLQNGSILEEGIGGVLFNLYKVSDNGNVQIGNTVETDKNGKLILSGLEVGNYYLEELALPQGYEFEKDAGGNNIDKFTFSILDDNLEAPLHLEIKNIKTEGSFTIGKELINSDGSPLEESQKQEEFSFVVLFGEKVSDINFDDETLYSYTINGGSLNTINNGDTIELKSGETATFENVQPNTKYKVVEIEREGYYVTSLNNEGVFTDNSNVKFINTVVKKGTGTIIIHKSVEEYPGLELPVDSHSKKFEFQIFFESDKSFPAKITGQETLQVKNGDSIYLQHGQSITLFDLPKGTSYSIKEMNYEDEGYFSETQSFEGNIGSNSLPLHYYFNNIFMGTENNLEEKVSLIVSKDVVNFNESDTLFEFYVDFLGENDIEYQVDDGEILSHSNEAPIYISNGQSINFMNVPIGAKYTVKESNSADYETLIEFVEGVVVRDGIEVVIKNFYTDSIADESTIRVSKTVSGKETDRKFGFKLTLGDKVEEFTLSHGESKYFNVPVGTKYSIVELDYLNEGFTNSISNGSGITNDFEVVDIDVINHYDYRNEKVILSGTKEWDVGNDGVKYIPDHISLDVYADGIVVKNLEVKPNENSEWKYEVQLSKYTSDHREIEYTIKERNVENFESKVDGLDIINTLTLPAKYDVKVTKKMSGDTLNKEVDFIFTLESLGNAPLQDKSSVTISGEGSSTFPTLVFEKEGTFKYLVKEVKGSEEGIKYDVNSVMVTIKVVREGYQLKVDLVEYLKLNGSTHESALFTNVYKKVVIPENPEEPNAPEKPEEKPAKPETPNGSGGGSQIGDLPHTGVATSKTPIFATISVLVGIFLILYKEDKQVKRYLRKDVMPDEE